MTTIFDVFSKTDDFHSFFAIVQLDKPNFTLIPLWFKMNLAQKNQPGSIVTVDLLVLQLLNLCVTRGFAPMRAKIRRIVVRNQAAEYWFTHYNLGLFSPEHFQPYDKIFTNSTLVCLKL